MSSLGNTIAHFMVRKWVLWGSQVGALGFASGCFGVRKWVLWGSQKQKKRTLTI